MRFASFLSLVCLGAFVVSCGDDSQPVTLAFDVHVGDQPFACGQTYEGLGTADVSLTPRDLRFFVHDVRLLEADGTEVPLALANDGAFQDGEVALLDFEDGCGDMGNAETNHRVTGRAPAGDYVGVAFRVGVPEAINHADPTFAPAPRNLTALWWNWNAGYKFVRLDATSSAFEGWRLHLGSTGCDGDMRGNATCANANRPEVVLDGDPLASTVVFDLAALVAGSELAVV